MTLVAKPVCSTVHNGLRVYTPGHVLAALPSFPEGEAVPF